MATCLTIVGVVAGDVTLTKIKKITAPLPKTAIIRLRDDILNHDGLIRPITSPANESMNKKINKSFIFF